MKIGMYSIIYRGVGYKGDAIDVFSLLKAAKEFGFERLELDAERPVRRHRICVQPGRPRHRIHERTPCRRRSEDQPLRVFEMR